mgnify:CR=1 FL=1
MLAVCTGNICRSAYVQHTLQAQLTALLERFVAQAAATAVGVNQAEAEAYIGLFAAGHAVGSPELGRDRPHPRRDPVELIRDHPAQGEGAIVTNDKNERALQEIVELLCEGAAWTRRATAN